MSIYLFLKLIFRYYYSSKSSAEHGTLYQLRNAINRTNVVQVPLNNFNACYDFFVLVVNCLILTAGMKMMEMESLDDTPSDRHVADPENVWMLSVEERQDLIQTVSIKIVDMFVDMTFNDNEDCLTTDKANLYSRRLLGLGLFYLEYSDAIREGDGERVLRCWRYMLPMFVSSGRKNYAIEAFNLLLQHDFSLPPRQAAELIWGRFINTTGLQGRNIPNDLHLEHLNRMVKTAIQNLRSNKTEAAITRVGKVLRILHPLLHNFDEENGVSSPSGKHSKPKEDKDINILMRNLSLSFELVPDRVYPSFPNPREPLHARSSEDLKTWITDHIKKKIVTVRK